MSANLSPTGLEIQTYEEILEEIVVALGAALGLDAAQTQRVRDGVESSLGQIVRVEAERESVLQESLLAVYNTISWYAEGALLDRVVGLLGVTRRAAFPSRVLGTATGTTGTLIPNGTRVQYGPAQTIWAVADGPYTIGPGGTSGDVAMVSEESAAHVVALDPVAGFDEWVVLDTVVGFDAFGADVQPVVGDQVEQDTALRVRAGVEAFRRGQGPLKAIEAAVTEVLGVTFVRAWENTGDATDADGIRSRSINVVVEGGPDAEVVAAILASRPAGMRLHGSDIVETVDLGSGRAVVVRADRVADLPIWIRVTLTTSTSEELQTPNVAAVVETRLLERAPSMFGIGADVLPLRLGAQLADLSGIDAALVELSLDGVVWSSAKQPVSIRQRPTFAAARISALEN